jgi:quercetin dioxygenase-like cupin family protein
VDSFYVLEGEVEFTIGDETRRAGLGTWVAALPHARHGFAIPAPEGAHFLNIHAPGSGFIDSIREDSP